MSAVMVMHPPSRRLPAYAHAPQSQHTAPTCRQGAGGTARLLVLARPASSSLQGQAACCRVRLLLTAIPRPRRHFFENQNQAAAKLLSFFLHSLVSSKLHLVMPMFLCTKLQRSQLHLFVIKFQQRKKTRNKG
jgi:hypothetical protein